ncbi:MAG: sulfotransferase family 2 domain-containing protein [Paracoccaceae bacterium]
MIIDYKNKLVFLATTKTASTSIEKCLSPLGYTGWIGGQAGLKHSSLKVLNKIRKPLGLDDFATWCIVRHPVEKLISWYNFRSRPQIKHKARYLGNKSFSEYLDTMTKQDKRGTNDSLFTCTKSGQSVDLMFALPDVDEWQGFLKTVYGITEVPRENVSKDYGKKYKPTDDELNRAKELLVDEIGQYEALKKSTLSEAMEFLSAKKEAEA